MSFRDRGQGIGSKFSRDRCHGTGSKFSRDRCDGVGAPKWKDAEEHKQ